jgi:hypothetical protein
MPSDYEGGPEITIEPGKRYSQEITFPRTALTSIDEACLSVTIKDPDEKHSAILYSEPISFKNILNPKMLEFDDHPSRLYDGTSISPDIRVASLVERKKPIPIQIEWTNAGEDHAFYNIHFNSLIQSPAGIILFNAKKEFVADLFDFDHFDGSHREIGPEDWTIVRKGEVVKINDSFVIPPEAVFHDIALDPQVPPKMLAGCIPPGHYYVQLVFWRLFAVPPFSESSDLRSHLDEREKLRQPIFRSNAIPIDIK